MTEGGVVAAVQLEIGADVLASADAYRRHLEAAVARAVDAARPAEVQLFVLPELAGHLALYALAPPTSRRAKTLGAALARAAFQRPLDVLRGAATTRLLDARHAVLAALAPDGERWWKSVFGPLARRLGAHVVAGSYLRLGVDGALYNASPLFGPDGQLLATTHKVNLVAGKEDGSRGALGLARGDASPPIVNTPLGRLATLIGYDGFREPHTREERFVVLGPRLAERGGVAIVANPASNTWPWRETWTLNDPGQTLTREQQWHAEGLPAALAQAGFARYGITAHLVGTVLDLSFEGQSEIIEHDAGAVRVLARAVHHDRGGDIIARVSC